MTHDPLCPTLTDPHGVGNECDCECDCEFIAKVREDERLERISASFAAIKGGSDE